MSGSNGRLKYIGKLAARLVAGFECVNAFTFQAVIEYMTEYYYETILGKEEIKTEFSVDYKERSEKND